MKKKTWLYIAAGALLLAILFAPIPIGPYKDGGTREYSALTYKAVKWQRDTGSDVYKATKVYWLPNNFKSLDELWAGEESYVPHRFTATVLEQALSQLGLTRREANEFIVYWLPLMEQNPYNVISFQTDAYTQAAQLYIDPAPDTLLRVFMAWQSSDSFVKLPAQALTAPARTGFTGGGMGQHENLLTHA